MCIFRSNSATHYALKAARHYGVKTASDSGPKAPHLRGAELGYLDECSDMLLPTQMQHVRLPLLWPTADVQIIPLWDTVNHYS